MKTRLALLFALLALALIACTPDFWMTVSQQPFIDPRFDPARGTCTYTFVPSEVLYALDPIRCGSITGTMPWSWFDALWGYIRLLLIGF